MFFVLGWSVQFDLEQIRSPYPANYISNQSLLLRILAYQNQILIPKIREFLIFIPKIPNPTHNTNLSIIALHQKLHNHNRLVPIANFRIGISIFHKEVTKFTFFYKLSLIQNLIIIYIIYHIGIENLYILVQLYWHFMLLLFSYNVVYFLTYKFDMLKITPIFFSALYFGDKFGSLE